MNCRPNVRVALVLLATAAVSLTACSSDGGAAKNAAPSSQAPAGTAHADLGDLHISGGYIPQPASPDVAAAYFTVTNDGSSADTLTRVTTDVTSNVMAMGESDHDGAGSMTDLSQVVVPAHGAFRFTPRHAHLMLQKPTRPLKAGQMVSMTITFTHAGTVRLDLPVVPISGPTGTQEPMHDMGGMSSGG
ncbi:MAG: copper chaperone PCu(A)C [Jatrophihabitans sp.]